MVFYHLEGRSYTMLAGLSVSNGVLKKRPHLSYHVLRNGSSPRNEFNSNLLICVPALALGLGLL